MDNYDDDHINILEFFETLWKGKFTICITVFLFSISSVFFALSLQDYYRSSSLLSVNQDSNSLGGLSSMASEYGSIASFAGISLPSQSGSKKDLVLATLNSRVFLERLLKNDWVLPGLYAQTSYNKSTQEIKYDNSLYDSISKVWKKDIQTNKSLKPSLLDAHIKYKNLLNIEENNSNGFIKIEIEHISPFYAKELIDLIIDEINLMIREQDLLESSNALGYLENQISKTQVAEIRNSINKMIEGQMKTQMLAKIKTDYSLSQIDPPYVPEKKSRPTRSVICIIGAVLGFAFGIFIVLFKHYILNLNRVKN
ncbi:Wzz/FepE/Etk N-terminal domain-containing protein [SAR86 cluster bacterium]|nr:Wzz/FepE/Etk N-terminal domain-containing protein [SAR86 cluster bacterium]